MKEKGNSITKNWLPYERAYQKDCTGIFIYQGFGYSERLSPGWRDCPGNADRTSLNEVKLSFYSNGIANSRDIVSGMSMDKVRLANLRSLGAMKLEVMSRRYLFRDYYDVYAILKEGISIQEIVTICGRYSRHRMKSKMILAILSNGSLFRYEDGFEMLRPKYKVNSEDIEAYLRERIREAYGQE